MRGEGVRSIALAVGLWAGVAVGLGAQEPARGTALTYRMVASGDVLPLSAHFSADRIGLIEKLNRADRDHLAMLDSLVIPVEWRVDELAYSPLPPAWAWAMSREKALVIDLASQSFGAYERGGLVRWGPVSSGAAATPTPAGLYHLTWRSKGRRSSDNPDWYMPWYFNFEPVRGLSLHEEKLPGRPASHACVRLLSRDARWLYEWGVPWTVSADGALTEPGTPVWVVGRYDYGASPPWRSFEWLSRGVTLGNPIDVGIGGSAAAPVGTITPTACPAGL